MTSAGTVYLETLADGPGGGRIYIRNDNVSSRNFASFTPLPATTWGDAPADFRKTNLELARCARVKLTDSLRIMSLTTQPGTFLDLNGRTLTVSAAELDGQYCTFSGLFSAADLQGMGFGSVTDAPEGDGRLRILGAPTMLIVR